MPHGSLVLAEIRMPDSYESELGLVLHGLGLARPVPGPEIEESIEPDKRHMIRTSRIMSCIMSSSLVTLMPEGLGMDLHAKADPGDDLLVQRRVTED